MTFASSTPDPVTAKLMEQILYEVKRVVVGQDRFLERVMVAMLAQGHLLNLLKDGRTVADRTDGQKTPLQLPGDTNGRLMVFKAFDKVSYALILQNTEAVKVGDSIAAR